MSVDSRTLAGLDEIRDRLGLESRGQALDAAVTESWRRRSGLLTLPTDGHRESEILARIEAMARPYGLSVEAVIEQVVTVFLESMATVGIA